MTSTGYIGADGKYHKGDTLKSVPEATSTQYKAWSHDRQRAEHQYDLIPPRKNGRMNPDFMEAYPEQYEEYRKWDAQT
jgi:hypothetical protein